MYENPITVNVKQIIHLGRRLLKFEALDFDLSSL